MKQYRKAKILLIALSALSGLTISGCGGSSENDPMTLNVICLNAGYGDAWIKTLAENWATANPDYKVNLTTSYDAASLIQKHLVSKNNEDDVYICVGASWKSYAAQGYFLSLDDLLAETVDDTTVQAKVNSEYQKSLSYKGKDGTPHAYRLPWTSGIGGIYFNAKMFETQGWNTPTTYAELLSLCQTIKDAKVPVAGSLTDVVKPFVYTGMNADYFDYTVFTWWAQLAGMESIQSFLNYPDASVYDAGVANSAYSYLKQATGLWDGLFGDSANFVEGSATKSNHIAQQNFLNGEAAMMFDGEWVYNEMLEYVGEQGFPSDFELRIMKTPTAPNAIDPHASYIVGEDQYMAIPTTSKKPELAKSFLKSIVSDAGCRTFLEKAHGLMAYDFDAEGVLPDNAFVSSVQAYKSNVSETFTNFSNNQMYLSNIIDIWGTSAYRPYSNILAGSATVNSAFSTIATETTRNWDTWKKQAGL